MQKLGYGPDRRLAVTVTTRNVAAYRDPAVILIDQLKEIYIDGTLKAIDTTQWYPTVMRKEYALAFTVTETGLDDPDQMAFNSDIGTKPGPVRSNWWAPRARIQVEALRMIVYSIRFNRWRGDRLDKTWHELALDGCLLLPLGRAP